MASSAHVQACADCASLHELLRAAASAGRGRAAATGLRSAADAHALVTIDSRGVSATAALTTANERPHPGLLVGGRYRLQRLLGEGGMGSVWAAEHVITRQQFALKLVRHALAQKPSMRRRMLREAKAASSVHHPNVVRVIDVFEGEGGTPVLVMDLLVGETLRDRLQRGPLGLGETARILVPALAAVQSAHAAGVIHRDLKPDNLFLVARTGQDPDVRVVDFGLARLIAVDPNSSPLTRSGEMLGTPSYMSPEQAFGEAELDGRTDVWAMGVILYECLAGRRPFDGDNFGQLLKRITSGERAPLAEVVTGLPPEVTALVDRLLTVPRDQRAGDLAGAIEVLARHANGNLERRLLRPPRRRGPFPVAAIGALVVVALTAGVAVTRPRPPAPSGRLATAPRLAETSLLGATPGMATAKGSPALQASRPAVLSAHGGTPGELAASAPARPKPARPRKSGSLSAPSPRRSAGAPIEPAAVRPSPDRLPDAPRIRLADDL